MEIDSPVSRLTSRKAERAPLCCAIAGRAASLYSLMALSRSVFLNLDFTTPAFMWLTSVRTGPTASCALRSCGALPSGSGKAPQPWHACRSPDSAPGLAWRVKARLVGRQRIVGGPDPDRE